MSSYEIESMLEMLMGSAGSFIGPVIASILSGVILTYCIRWFIFVKAGEKGWKALIPFYSDYINYKIAWEGRIYLLLLAGTAGSWILGSVFGLLSPGLGMVVSILLSTVVAGAKAVAKMILQFKFARAFGKNEYFAVGLYFLNNVFTAILAFGDCEYRKAPQNTFGAAMRPEQYPQRDQNAGGFPPVQQSYPQQPANPGAYQQPRQFYGSSGYAPVQQYPQQTAPQNPMNQNPYHP